MPPTYLGPGPEYNLVKAALKAAETKSAGASTDIHPVACAKQNKSAAQ